MSLTDWAKHYREVYATEINKLKLGDTIGFAFEGPTYVPSPQGLIVGWSAMVTLKHNVLLGQPDIGVHIPIMGITVEDEIVRKAAGFLVEAAREERHKMNNPPLPDPEVKEGVVVPGGVPAGLQRPNGEVRTRQVAPGLHAKTEGRRG